MKFEYRINDGEWITIEGDTLSIDNKGKPIGDIEIRPKSLAAVRPRSPNITSFGVCGVGGNPPFSIWDTKSKKVGE